MTEPLGSVAWVERGGGRLSGSERLAMGCGIVGALVQGFRLGFRALWSPRRNAPLFEPPETPMVHGAREYLLQTSGTPMIHHCFRTAFWTTLVLHQHDALNEQSLETAWVAALLHDVGLDAPPERGDFSLGGVQVLDRLARDLRWNEEQAHLAAEAIAVNLSTNVDAARLGMVAWAMNAGGAGDLGYGPYRLQMHPSRIAELEARYPRSGFRTSALHLIDEEIHRVPDGRFALMRPVFWLLMHD